MAIKRSLVCILGIGLTLAVACGGGRAGPVGPWPKPRDPPVQKVAASEEFSFKLRDGAPPGREPIPVAPATPLDEKATAAVIARLPAMTKGAEDEKAFALRESSKPPPRAGKTISQAFPPAKTAPPPDPTEAGPLKVLRHSPDGEVGLAPSLSVTFSQPMVAVTSVGDLARQAVPVKLSPEPQGKWRWLGTKTLVFEPSPRFPMATDYTVEVPAGVKSANGGALAGAETFRFSTPPPKLEEHIPSNGPSRRDPVFFAAFDQRIVPASVLKTVRVTGGGAAVAVREASAAEIQADAAVKDLVRDAKEGRWLAFRAVKPLPADSGISVTVGPGTPSAEGPRVTKAPQAWSFKTFGALKVTRHECGWGSGCRPFMPFNVQFSNPLDAKRFDQGMVHVDPPIPGLKVEVYGNSMSISGRTKGRTTYKVTLAPTILDEFGQTLEKAQTVELDVGEAQPALTAEGGKMVVLDPAGSARFSVYTVNHDALSVRAYAVVPEQWEQYSTWLQRSQRDRGREPPGKQVISTTVDVDAEDDELTETRIDLSSALKGGLGQLILVVTPKGGQSDRGRDTIETWIQSTRIGLDAFADPTELLGWASSLVDGKPLEGASLTLLPGKASATTAANGLASITLGAARGGLLVARKGADSAILPESEWGGIEGSWSRQAQGSVARWFVFDDRGMYRPGEEVKIKGWIRRVGMFEGGDVGEMSGADAVTYKLNDSRGNEVARGRAELSALGGFDASLKLPPTVNLGYAQIVLVAAKGGAAQSDVQHEHGLQIQEFRRPEFEVSTAAGAGPFFYGEHADVSVSASYYAGGGLPNAAVTWNVAASPGSFTPPNRSDFTFGTWIPWWGRGHMFGPPGFHGGGGKSESFQGRTDGGGKHHLRIDFGSGRPPRPMAVSATASVSDVNRQAWAATQSLLVHPSTLYVGLRSPRLFVQQGEALPVDAIVTDLDGKAITGRAVTVRAVRLDWRQVGGEQVEEELDPETCQPTSAVEPVRCTFKPKEGGTFKVTATVADDKGRLNQSEITLWVAGGKAQPSRGVAQEQVTLVPDKKAYKRGDTAEILVLPPFSPAEGLLTLRRSGIVKTERFTIAGSSHTVKVPIDDGHVPNVELQIDLVGAAHRATDAGEPDLKLPKRPAFAAGSVSLSVPPVERTLAVRVTPRDKGLEPGGQTVVDVEAKDAAGRPVANAEVAVIVVDEAVLALSGYQLPDPVAAFYQARSGDTRDHHLRASVILGRPDDVARQAQSESKPEESMATGVPGGAAPAPPPAPAASAAPKARMSMSDHDGVPDKADADPIKLRSDFNALATFAPKVPTDNDGRVQVPVKVPDNLTRYRVMAVAVAGGQKFGSAESAITARLPIMVRPSAPRFLNFGDRFELPIVVQNQTEKPVEVDVAVRTANATLTAGAGRRVKVPANDRVEVRFPVAAARAGTARFQVGAAAGRWADAAEVALPVWTPATTEAFATYGEIDAGAITQPVASPTDVVTEYGGLEITTSSTALQALTDAVLYLVAYPFECSEQLASRVLAIAALKDVLAAFDAEGLPPPAQLLAAVKRDVDRLTLLQNSDGGWGFWRRDSPSWPFLSIHVAHALQRAKEKGFTVPAPALEGGRRYLRAIETHIPSWYGPDERRTIIAYALYTRARMGDRDVARAKRLVQEVGADKLPLETAGFVLSVLSGSADAAAEVAGIRKLLANRVTETAGAAHFATSYADGGYVLLHSDRRADGILLEALIGDQPKGTANADLIPKIVAGLLAHRKAGRWGNTQENAFVLLALDRYFSVYEKVTPDFVAKAWLGDKYAGEHRFKGRTTERQHIEVPMKDVVAGSATKDLVIAKDGVGRLYYRIGMRYAPKDLRLPPSSNGFTVERVYEPVDRDTDVTRGADGTWRVKAGAKVRVRLSMLAPSRRYHVALVDPLPAGLEPMNPALAVTGEVPKDPKDQAGRGGWWWRGTWYEHQNLRDERVEAFTTLLWEGLHTYTYVARATTPGTFVVPPPKAEEMYHPETFGRGAGDRLIVE